MMIDRARGTLALVGAGEYLESMAAVDRRLLARAAPDARPARVVCLPTAAGAEGTSVWQRWCHLGAAHFERLGASVDALPVVDRGQAEDADFTATVARADLVYFSGGDPHYLEATLRDTPLWRAAYAVYARGGVLAGCSAGAMVLAEWLLLFGSGFYPSGWSSGLGLIPQTLVVPHFDYRGFDITVSIAPLRRRLPDEVTIVGVDEHTALVGRPGEAWEVLGRSSVTLWRLDGRDRFESGQVVPWWGRSA